MTFAHIQVPPEATRVGALSAQYDAHLRDPQCPLHVDSGLSLVDRADVRFCLSSPHNLSPHLTGRLVLPQPDVNRVPQQIVGRPGQKGDLSDKLRFDPMDAG
jgi:hypothetical protein